MRTALIIGITGNFGHQMAITLLHNGWDVRAVLRDPTKLPSGLSKVEIFKGSATNSTLVNQSAQGCELIVYAANPMYHRWSEEAVQMLEPAIAAASSSGARILFPGNVYNYQPQTTPIDEDVIQTAPTEKGKIRVMMEHKLKQASLKGVKVTVIRAGDFIGPNAHFTWLNMAMKQKASTTKLSLPHDSLHRHFWSYLPDLCNNAETLVNTSTENFELWHDVGLSLTSQDWIDALKENKKTVKQSAFPWIPLKVMALFSPKLNEVIKMRYLWKRSVLLDGTKMTRHLGEKLHSTPLSTIISELS
ncbi:MAG: nucleoside-diphosphate-sugar epimerase [Porticoccaceae bacterium]|jgi:nucleoside-diphosphate-sugar epimerase